MTEQDIDTLRPVDIFGPVVDTTFPSGTGTGLRYVATADGVVSGQGEASCIGAGMGSLLLPENYFYQGRTLRTSLFGRLTSPPAVSGSGTIRVTLGPAPTTRLMFTLDVGLSRTTSWTFSNIITCRIGGASGAFAITGFFFSTSALGAVISSQIPFIPSNADMTQAMTLDVKWTWAEDGGSFVCNNALIEVLS